MSIESEAGWLKRVLSVQGKVGAPVKLTWLERACVDAASKCATKWRRAKALDARTDAAVDLVNKLTVQQFDRDGISSGAETKARLSLRGRCLLAAVRDFHRAWPQGGAKAAVAAVDRIALIDRVYQGFVAEVPKGRCECCGRELMDPESVRKGIGPECNRRLEASAKVLAAFGL